MGKQHRYALTARQLFYACWQRENLLVSRNMFQYGFRFFITVVMVRHVSRDINGPCLSSGLVLYESWTDRAT